MNAALALCLALLPGAEPNAPLAAKAASVELGEVKSGPISIASFELRNVAEAGEIVFGDVVTSCGCGKPAFAAKSIKSGEATSLTMRLSTLTLAEGKHAWPIRLRYTHDGTEHELELALSAKIVREITVTPAVLALSITGEANHSLIVRDRRAKPLKVTSATCSDPSATFAVKERTSTKDGSEQSIALNVADSLKAGSHEFDIVLATDDPECPTLTVPLKIRKRSPDDVQATPSEPIVRFAKGKSEASAKVVLRRNGREFEIAKVESNVAGVSATFSEGAGTVAAIKVRVDAERAGASGAAELTVTFADSKLTKLTIPVAWVEP